MRRRVLRYLSLRPYGDALLTPAGAFWIFAVPIAILLMASAEERSVGSAPMTSLRFEDWCLNTYPAIRARDVNAVQSGERTQFFSNSASELSAITAAVTTDEVALISELAALESQRQNALAERAAVERALAIADEQLAELKSQRATLEAGLKRPGPAQIVAAIVSTLAELEGPAGDAASQKAAAHEKLDTLTPLLADLDRRCAELTSRVEKVARTRQQAEAELAAIRLRHMAELNRALTARWPEATEAKPALLASDTDVPKRLM